jgi:hypothetical protein
VSIAIRWGFLPAEIRDAVRPYLLNYLWILPSWVHLLHVGYTVVDADSPGTTAEMKSAPSYRQATLTVYAAWLSESPTRRERIILHELIHPTYAPVLIATNDAVKAIIATSTPGYAIVAESLRSTSEGATVDLERALFGKRFPPPPFTEEEDEQAPAADALEKRGEITSSE